MMDFILKKGRVFVTAVLMAIAIVNISFSNELNLSHEKWSDKSCYFKGKITYVNNETEPHIYSIDGKTGKKTNLTQHIDNLSMIYSEPTWSSDGETVVFNTSLKGWHSISSSDKTGEWIVQPEYNYQPKKEEGDWYTRWNVTKELYTSIKAKHDVSSKLPEDLKKAPYIDIFSINGKHIKRIILDSDTGLYGWSFDSRHLFIAAGNADNPIIKLINVDTGESCNVGIGTDVDYYYDFDKQIISILKIISNRDYTGDKELYDESYVRQTANELGVNTKETARILRNELFARHGHDFKSNDLRVYFGNTRWYKPDPNYTDDRLNDIERKNVQFILDYEKKMGWR